MPIYQYDGVHYDIDTTDQAEAKKKIEDHLLGQINRSPLPGEAPNQTFDQALTRPRSETMGSGLESIVDAAKGVSTGIGNVVGSIPGFLGGLPYYAKELYDTGSFKKASEAHSAIVEGLNPIAGDTAYGKAPWADWWAKRNELKGTQNVGEVLNAPFEGFGRIGAAVADQMGKDPEEAYHAGMGLSQIGAAFLPGLAKKGDTVRANAKRAEARARAEMEKLDAEKNQKVNDPNNQAALPGFEPEGGLQTPYGLMTDSRRQALEAELNPPVETRQPGQGELFSQNPELNIPYNYHQGELDAASRAAMGLEPNNGLRGPQYGGAPGSGNQARMPQHVFDAEMDKIAQEIKAHEAAIAGLKEDARMRGLPYTETAADAAGTRTKPTEGAPLGGFESTPVRAKPDTVEQPRIYEAEPNRPPVADPMGPPAPAGEFPPIPHPQGGFDYPGADPARRFNSPIYRQEMLSAAQPKPTKNQPAPLQMESAGAPATQTPGFLRSLEQVMEAKDIERLRNQPFEKVNYGISNKGPRGRQTGAIYFDKALGDTIKARWQKAFDFIKKNWPRFSENTPIYMLSEERFAEMMSSRVNDKSLKNPAWIKGFYDPKYRAILINGEHFTFAQKYGNDLLDRTAEERNLGHELTHGLQDSRFQTKADKEVGRTRLDRMSDATPKTTKYEDRPWEKEAWNTEKTILERFKKQGGVINPDLLTLGVSKLIDEIGSSETWKKFKGTFGKNAMEGAEHAAQSAHPRETLVWMSPDEFHRLAADRSDEYREGPIAEAKRVDIRGALNEKSGLADIPFLRINPSKDDGRGYVVSHEGRHRMDVFREQGIDLVPVRIIHGDEPLNYEQITPEASYGRGVTPVRRDMTPIELNLQDRRVFPRDRDLSEMGQQPAFSSQRGGPKDGFKTFSQDMKAKGINLPEDALRRIYDEEIRGKKPTMPNNSTKANLLPKEIRELYKGDQTLQDLENALKEYGKGDAWIGNAGIPQAYNAQRHAITRWMNAKVNAIKTAATKWGEAMRIGEQVGRFGGRQVAQDSPQGRWDALDKSQKMDMVKLHNFLSDRNLALDDSSAQQALGRTLTEGERQAMDGIQSIAQKILDEVINPLREQRGQEPIRGRNFYGLPALWKGDYIAFIKDKNGVIQDVVGLNFRPDSAIGKVFNRELKARLAKAGADVQDMTWKKTVTNNEFSIAGMELLMERSSKLNPEAKAVLDELIADFSYGKARGMEREGRPGYRGSEGGSKGLRQFEKVRDEMIERATTMKAQLDLGKLYREFNASDKIGEYPNAKRIAMGHLDQAMGREWAWTKALDDALASVLDRAGLPPSALRSFVHGSGNYGTTALMAGLLAIQLAIQTTQPLLMLPKMASVYGDALGRNPVKVAGHMTKAVLGALRDFWNPEIMKQLALEGTFEPTLSKEAGFGSKFQGAATARGVANTLKGYLPLQFVESNAVRKPAALLNYNMLKELGLEGKELVQITKGLTEDYMVSWDRWKKAPIVAQSGLVGDIFGRLSSFPITWIANFLEYGKKAMTKADFLPIATFLGITYMTAGLMNFVGVKEADAVIDAINAFTEKDIPTVSERILTNAKSDAVRYGIPSAVTGTNVGSSMAAGSVMGFGTPPTISLWMGLFKTMDILYREMEGDPTRKPTHEEKREAFKPLIFRSLHGQLETPGSLLSTLLGTAPKEGTPGANMITDNTGRAIHERNDFDRLARNLGTYSLEEAEARREKYLGNKEEQELKGNRTKYLDRLTQHILEGGQFDDAWNERAKQLKYTTTTELTNGLKSRILEKLVTDKVLDVRQATTPKQQRMYLFYRQLGGTDRELRDAAGR